MKTRASRMLTMLLTLALVLQAAALPVTAAAKAPTIETVLNNAPLHPASSGSAGIDAYMAQVLAQITTPQMTTYQKVKAIYDYVINHTYYDMYIDRGITYPADYRDRVSVGYTYGYATLASGRGVCQTYASSFAMLARYIGLNAYVVAGQTHKSGGGYTPHGWGIINVNGTEYVFDPQIDDNIAKGGKIGYYRFGKLYSEMPDKYIYEYRMNYFEPLTGYEAAPKAAIPYPAGAVTPTATQGAAQATTQGNTKADAEAARQEAIRVMTAKAAAAGIDMTNVDLRFTTAEEASKYIVTSTVPVATRLITDMYTFDWSAYNSLYSDLFQAFGNNPQALYDHYVNYGIKEGRFPNAYAYLMTKAALEDSQRSSCGNRTRSCYKSW